MKFRKFLVAVLAAVMVLGIGLTAHAESQNDQLALYYATLWQMGGNAECSAEQAQIYAQYYAQLAAAEKAGGGVSPVTPAAPAKQGIMLQVQNVNASDDFYNRVVNYVYNLPEPVKRRLSKYKIVFCTYANGAGFGYSGANGLTRCTRTLTGSKRSVEFKVMLSQTASDPNFTIYHELGHVFGNIFWKEVGIRGSESQTFLQCVAGEVNAMASLRSEINATPGYEENFADSFANFYLNNARFAAACPKLNYYWCCNAPQ